MFAKHPHAQRHLQYITVEVRQPATCPCSPLDVFSPPLSLGEVDACQGAKRSVTMLQVHTSKGGGWLVVPGGDALSYASDNDFLLKRPADGFSIRC